MRQAEDGRESHSDHRCPALVRHTVQAAGSTVRLAGDPDLAKSSWARYSDLESRPPAMYSTPGDRRVAVVEKKLDCTAYSVAASARLDSRN